MSSIRNNTDSARIVPHVEYSQPTLRILESHSEVRHDKIRRTGDPPVLAKIPLNDIAHDEINDEDCDQKGTHK
jgi:hypothetical protein